MDGPSEQHHRPAAPEPDLSFREAVIAGLAKPQKAIPSRYFYDERGSALFEQICSLEEYYPTRTEIAILEACCGEIGSLLPPGSAVIEMGSGSSTKVRTLLDSLRTPSAYVPVDISREHLIASARSLAKAYPQLTVIPVWGDFARKLSMPVLPDAPRVIFFPGSTIGNFTPQGAVALLAGWGGHIGLGGHLIIGVDLKKNAQTLEAAYDDAAGVTAAFNLNLLVRANRELGATFDLDCFAFDFAAGESIHTENSYKYTVEEFQTLAREAGYQPVAVFTDSEAKFSVHVLQVQRLSLSLAQR